MCISTNSEHEIVRCECSRAPKTGAQLRDNPEEREKCGKNDEKARHRRHNRHQESHCNVEEDGAPLTGSH